MTKKNIKTPTKKFIMDVAQALVDKPDEVKINGIKSDSPKSNLTVYELHVHKEDLGKVIGKLGASARAFRLLLSAVATKNGERATLEIIEP